MRGRIVSWKPGASGGSQVSVSRSASLRPPAVAVTTSRVTPSTSRLTPFVLLVGVIRTATGRLLVVHTGVVVPAGTIAPRALARTCGAALAAGRTVTPVTLPGAQLDGTLRQAPTANRHVPSTVPSASHVGSPSWHESVPDVVPDHSTRQSVAGGPPPGKQPSCGQAPV